MCGIFVEIKFAAVDGENSAIRDFDVLFFFPRLFVHAKDMDVSSGESPLGSYGPVSHSDGGLEHSVVFAGRSDGSSGHSDEDSGRSVGTRGVPAGVRDFPMTVRDSPMEVRGIPTVFRVIPMAPGSFLRGFVPFRWPLGPSANAE